MKRITEAVETNELCKYGCGQVAKYRNGQGNLMCCKSSNSCPENKKKNSKAIAQAHKDGKIPTNFGNNQGWSKGLSKETDHRIANYPRPTGYSRITPSEETRNKLRIARIKNLQDGKHDTSGRKGHRGHYDGQFFHSSWELAFYIFNKEHGMLLKKNSTTSFDYEHEGKIFKYVPDFTDENGSFYEVKSYLFSTRDISKYNQTKDKAKYFFGDALKPMIDYMTEKHGKQFWDKFYAPVVQ